VGRRYQQHTGGKRRDQGTPKKNQERGHPLGLQVNHCTKKTRMRNWGKSRDTNEKKQNGGKADVMRNQQLRPQKQIKEKGRTKTLKEWLFISRRGKKTGK